MKVFLYLTSSLSVTLVSSFFLPERAAANSAKFKTSDTKPSFSYKVPLLIIQAHGHVVVLGGGNPTYTPCMRDGYYLLCLLSCGQVFDVKPRHEVMVASSLSGDGWNLSALSRLWDGMFQGSFWVCPVSPVSIQVHPHFLRLF